MPFGQEWTFAIHEALDQSGALIGPLVVAGMVAVSGYRVGFAVLAVPGALAVLALMWLRHATPVPAAYSQAEPGRAAAKPAAGAVHFQPRQSLRKLEIFGVALQAAALIAFIPLTARPARVDADS